MKKILIIGGSGFIGSHFHQNIPQEKIINLDLVSPKFSHHATYISGDIRNQEDINQALAKHPDCDTIINLAAEHSDFGISQKEYLKTNEYGSKMMCEAANKFGIKNIIFYSSVAVYGNNIEPSTEASPALPANDYGQSKLLAEKVIKDWATEDSSRKVLIIRPVVVYGERNVANMHRLITQINKGRYFHIGQGNNIKSIAYVKNIVQATLFLINRMQEGVHIYNYADEEQLSSREIANTISTALGKKQAITLPYSMVYALGLPFDLLIKLTGRNFPISTSRIKKFCTETHHLANKIKETGFVSKYSNKEGLQNMVKWMMHHKETKKKVEKELEAVGGY